MAGNCDNRAFIGVVRESKLYLMGDGLWTNEHRSANICRYEFLKLPKTTRRQFKGVVPKTFILSENLPRTSEPCSSNPWSTMFVG